MMIDAERLDQHISGISTPACNYLFYTPSIIKWKDSSCPVKIHTFYHLKYKPIEQVMILPMSSCFVRRYAIIARSSLKNPCVQFALHLRICGSVLFVALSDVEGIHFLTVTL